MVDYESYVISAVLHLSASGLMGGAPFESVSIRVSFSSTAPVFKTYSKHATPALRHISALKQCGSLDPLHWFVACVYSWYLSLVRMNPS